MIGGGSGGTGPGVGGGGGGAGGGRGGGSGSGDGGAAGGLGAGLAFTVKGLTLTVKCSSACTITAALPADKATVRKLHLRGAKIGAGSKRLKAAGTAKITLKVSRKLAKRLKGVRGAKGTVKVTVTGAGGVEQTAIRPVRLGR